MKLDGIVVRRISDPYADVIKSRVSGVDETEWENSSSSGTCSAHAENYVWKSPFRQPGESLLRLLLEHKEFDKSGQWQLSITEFQKLTQRRLQLLLSTGEYSAQQLYVVGIALGESRATSRPIRRTFDALYFASMVDLSLLISIGTHIMGASVLLLHGSNEQRDKLLPSISGPKQDIYCFGATEISHGSNLKQIQTTAVYDRVTDEFILTTPSQSASKYWIGNSTFVAEYMVVLAQIVIDGEEHGVAWFRVPLWEKEQKLSENKQNRHRRQGIDIRDVGTKCACNGLGNGCISFNNVRLRREDCLMSRYCRITKDGTLLSDLTQQDRFVRCLQTFVLERSSIAMASAGCAAVALTIAIKYACNRRQFGTPLPSSLTEEKPSSIVSEREEFTLMSYPMHARRLMPHVARMFSLKTLVDEVADLAELTFESYTFNPDRKALHVLTSAMKVSGSQEAYQAAQEARECCGGHGFAAVNQVGMIRNDLDVLLTGGGDNSLLALEIMRFKLKTVFETWPMSKKILGPARPKLRRICERDMQRSRHLMNKALRALIFREEKFLHTHALQFRKAEDAYEQFKDSSYDLREAAKSVYDRISVKNWLERNDTTNVMDKEKAKMVDQLGMLNAIGRLLEHSSWFLCHRVMSASSVRRLSHMEALICKDLAANKTSELVDALGVPEPLLADCPLAQKDYSKKLAEMSFDSPPPTTTADKYHAI